MVKTEPRTVSAKSADNLSTRTDSATIYHATPESSGADMDAKRLGKQVVGGLLTLVGCAFSLSVVRVLALSHIENLWTRGLALTLWNIGGLVLLAALSGYLVGSGLRMMNPQLVKPFRFGRGKIIVGSWVLFSRVGSHYHLVPDGPVPILKPSNPTQAVSIKVTGIVVSLVVAYLIFRGILQGFTRPESQSDTLPPQSPESGR